MKTVSTIARFVLALMFLVFGLNGFLQFIKLPPPTGAAAQFMGALFVSHEIVVIMAIQVLAGVLLLWSRFVPLALILLAPIIVNIGLFHAFMAPSGLPLPGFAVILWLLAAVNVKDVLLAVLRSPTPAEAT
jgi:putative oxidoreductase